MSQAFVVGPPEDERLCPGQTYTYFALGGLPPILDFSWTQISGPAGGVVTFTNTTALQTNIEVNISGVYEIRYCYYTNAAA